MTVLVVDRGCEFKYVWPVFAPDGITPLDLAGWSGSGWIRSVIQDEFLVADVSAWFTLAAGTATLTVPGPTSTAWPWERGVFSFELTDPSARSIRLDSGLILATYF